MTELQRRARELQGEIARVLLRDWDPIGVADIPEAQDEYDSYVGQVYRLLASGATARQVAEHLLAIETVSMGLGASTVESLMPVAERLIALDVHPGWS